MHHPPVALPVIHERPSPNYRDRGGQVVELIVVHSDASPSLTATIDWLSRDKESLRKLWERTPKANRPAKPWGPVSYHYSIGRTAWVCRHVADKYAAYHAGTSIWKGKVVKGGVNDFSIGVNLSNRQNGKELYPEVQLEMGAKLIAWLLLQHSLPLQNVTTHARCATPTGRKRDPYPNEPTFNFARFMERVTMWSGRLFGTADAAPGADG